MNKMKTITLLIAILALVGALFMVACTKSAEEIKTDNGNQEVTNTPPIEHISFTNILNSPDKKTIIPSVTLKGYLKEQQTVSLVGRNQTSFNDDYYIVDDDGYKIKLSLVDPSKIISTPNTELMKYFTVNETTTDVYSISGELQWNFEKPIIYVKTITLFTP